MGRLLIYMTHACDTTHRCRYQHMSMTCYATGRKCARLEVPSLMIDSNTEER